MEKLTLPILKKVLVVVFIFFAAGSGFFNAMSSSTITVLVLGGGNGAHVMTGVAGTRPNVKVRVMSLFADEAERWSKLMKDSNLKVTGTTAKGKSVEYKSKPILITNDPAKAVAGAQIILLVVPAFAHDQYFKAIAPHLQKGAVIVGLPGGAGFEFAAHHILGEIGKTCTILNYESLPWAARIVEFGKHVEIIGFKEKLTGAMQVGSMKPLIPPAETLQMLLGSHPKLTTKGHLLAIAMQGVNVIHLCLMYSKWEKGWDGKPLEKPPLFYHEMDELAAQLLTDANAEMLQICAAITKKHPEVDLSIIRSEHDFYLDNYSDQIKDNSTLLSCCRTNAAYEGLVHPCKKLPDGKYMPDFSYRYTTEDVPYGLVILKGLAELAEVKTPTIDMLTRWGQEKMGKEYLVGDKLVGKDLQETRAPQKYGIKTLKAALGLDLAHFMSPKSKEDL